MTNDVPPLGCRHTLDVKRNLGGWFAKYSRMDAHSLGRLRVRDRHSDPPPSSASVVARSGDVGDAYVRFEILRHSQNLKRGSGVDCNRLEVELHGGQRTLLDLHRLMVEFALDKEVGGGGGGGGSIGPYEEEVRGREEGCAHAATPTLSLDGSDDIVSGVFFIENAFYTCGEVGGHVAESILRWLDCEKEPADKPVIADGGGPSLSPTAGKPTPSSQRRRRFLGLAPLSWPSSRTKIVPMSETKLDDLPLRLGVRYFHMFAPPPTPSSLRLLLERQHGGDATGENYSSWSLAYESAVFVTGIRTLNVDREAFKKKRRVGTNDQSTIEDNEEEDKALSEDKAPILIHDTWAPQRHICLACNHSPASVVTVNDELTDAAPPGLDPTTNKVQLQGVPMCSSCYRALHYHQQRPSDEEDMVGGGYDEDADDRYLPSLKLRPSKHGQASLVFPIEEYQRLVTVTSLEDVPKSSAF
ncbi:hypothetical protein ACHAW5_005194 [Stephanodiscus triporus]|uniref:snRNA-activating protein complex subunit 3 n=1 Tax=Stephanodiscus triporus TaxID=2934178 RepID=A0ABD3NKR2_9STRA